MIFLFIGFIWGLSIGLAFPQIVSGVRAFRRWLRSNRRFVCDACKTKTRAKNGYTPVAIDLEPATGVVPVNLLLCRKCIPNA
jgi:hypothetical protein